MRSTTAGPFTHDADRLRPAALHEVAGVEPGHVGLLEQLRGPAWKSSSSRPRSHGVRSPSASGQQVERTRPLGVVEVDGDGDHALLLEPVDLPGRGAEEVRVADEQRDLLLGRRAEIEAVGDAAGELDGRRVLAHGVEDQRREQEPLRVLELGVLARPRGGSVVTISRIRSTS